MCLQAPCRPLALSARLLYGCLCAHIICPGLFRRLMSGSGASSSGRQMQSTVLGSYKAELREFRALQEELEPWTEAFKEQHQRKPTLADVQATRETASPDLLLHHIANRILRAAQHITNRPLRVVAGVSVLTSSIYYIQSLSWAVLLRVALLDTSTCSRISGCTQHLVGTRHCCFALQAYHGS